MEPGLKRLQELEELVLAQKAVLTFLRDAQRNAELLTREQPISRRPSRRKGIQ